MTTRWMNLIERSEDETLGAALVRLARVAADVHRLEADRLERDAAGGMDAAADEFTGTYLAVDMLRLEEVSR